MERKERRRESNGGLARTHGRGREALEQRWLFPIPLSFGLAGGANDPNRTGAPSRVVLCAPCSPPAYLGGSHSDRGPWRHNGRSQPITGRGGKGWWKSQYLLDNFRTQLAQAASHPGIPTNLAQTEFSWNGERGRFWRRIGMKPMRVRLTGSTRRGGRGAVWGRAGKGACPGLLSVAVAEPPGGGGGSGRRRRRRRSKIWTAC